MKKLQKHKENSVLKVEQRHNDVNLDQVVLVSSTKAELMRNKKGYDSLQNLCNKVQRWLCELPGKIEFLIWKLRNECTKRF